MISALNFQNKYSDISFKNHISADKSNEKFYKTHAGLKTAAGYSVVGIGVLYGIDKFFNSANDKASSLSKFTSRMSKISPFLIGRFVVTSLTCGAIADALINKKREKLASDMQVKDKETLLKENKNIKKTKKGNLYYKSNVTDNIGPLMALGVYVLNSAINLTVKAVKKQKVRVDGWDIVDGIMTAIAGGCVLGWITDKFSNKAAKAFADKQQ